MMNIAIGTVPYDQAERVLQTLQASCAIQKISVALKDRKEIHEQQGVDAIIGKSLGIQGVRIENEVIDFGGPLAGLLDVSESATGGEVLTGPLTAGLMNAFMDIGMLEDDATYFAKQLLEGEVLIGVSDEKDMQSLLEQANVQHMVTFSSESAVGSREG